MTSVVELNGLTKAFGDFSGSVALFDPGPRPWPRP